MKWTTTLERPPSVGQNFSWNNRSHLLSGASVWTGYTTGETVGSGTRVTVDGLGLGGVRVSLGVEGVCEEWSHCTTLHETPRCCPGEVSRHVSYDPVPPRSNYSTPTYSFDSWNSWHPCDSVPNGSFLVGDPRSSSNWSGQTQHRNSE